MGPLLRSGGSSRTSNNLPDDLTEGNNIGFEIEKNGIYYFYEYLEPAYFRLVDTPSMEIYRFLRDLNQETGIDVYSPGNLVMKPKT